MGFDQFSLSHDFCGFLAGQKDGCMGRRHIHVSARLRERRHNGVVLKAALAQQLIRSSEPDRLCKRKRGKEVCAPLGQSQPEHPDQLVLPEHALRKHDVSQVDFPDHCQRIIVHDLSIPFGSLGKAITDP